MEIIDTAGAGDDAVTGKRLKASKTYGSRAWGRPGHGSFGCRAHYFVCALLDDAVYGVNPQRILSVPVSITLPAVGEAASLLDVAGSDP